VRTYWNTLKLVRYSLLTIACMLAIEFITRLSGIDATLGLAFANTGRLYPLFGTMLGWLGVALTGSDTSSNVLFGSLQRITAEQLALNPILMSAAKQLGWRHGQNDRRPEHRGSKHGDVLVRPCGRHPALRLLAFARPGRAGRRAGLDAGVCVAPYRPGGALRHEPFGRSAKVWPASLGQKF
jgi:L-lactate permease